METIKEYLKDEHLDKRKTELNIDEWQTCFKKVTCYKFLGFV